VPRRAIAPWGEGISVSILVVDDEPDVALLFRQRFRREVREGIFMKERRPMKKGRITISYYTQPK
jgi:hypothetical protein